MVMEDTSLFYSVYLILPDREDGFNINCICVLKRNLAFAPKYMLKHKIYNAKML